METKAYFIAPYESGLINNVKPWLSPEEAFTRLNNAYVWRGMLKKRIGSRLFSGATLTAQQLASRLRIQINTTDVTGAATQAGGAIPGAITGADCIGQMFSIGTELFTVQATGTPVNMLKTGATATAQYNTTTLAYTFAGAAPSTAVYWYPSLPVMGIMTYENANINNEEVFAFDTHFSYRRVANAWERAGTLVWAGSNSQFFWGTNYRGAAASDYLLFVVNNNRADRICYWDGVAGTFTRTGAAVFSTKANNVGVILAANFVLQSGRLIFSFKERLIVLNTLEQVDDGAGNPVNATFVNRARWCTPTSPFNANSWQDDVAGGGGFADCPTRQAIISAQILNDRLIVYFERSTWELVYTTNVLQPFLWQCIDDAVGVESTFSTILMEDAVLGIGLDGIYSCNGERLTRIDENIPDEVFKIHNGNNGVERVAGIRDFVTEVNYWTFPSAKHNTTYPDRLIVYNYKNKSWAFFDDSITAFGYAQNETDETWAADLEPWITDDSTWDTGADQSLYRNVIAGNQEGFTFIMDREIDRNAQALQITNVDITTDPGSIIFTVINHNCVTAERLQQLIVENVQGMTNINDRVYTILEVTANTIRVQADPDNPPAGTYTGGGLISRVSKLDIKTKAFNFYTNALRTAINKIVFHVDRTSQGSFKVQYKPGNGINIGNFDNGFEPFEIETYPYALYTYEANQSQLVRPIYPYAEGDCIQLRLFTDYDEHQEGYYNAIGGFVLNSLTFYATPTTSRY